MNSVVGRRVFVGSVVAGLPLIAGAGARTFAQTALGNGSQRPDEALHHPSNGVDPLQEHLFREVAALHNRMRREIRGEDARAFASQLRTLAVYGRQQGVDAKVRTILQSAIDQNGRDLFLLHEPDATAMRAELERYGFQLDERTRHLMVPHDPGSRNVAIDKLLTEGVTPTWDRLATLFDRAAPAIDRRNGAIVRVGLSAQDAEYWAAYCATLWGHYLDAQQMASAVCAFMAISWIAAILWPSCFALQGGAAVVLLFYVFSC